MEVRRQLSRQLPISTVGSEDTTRVLSQAWVVSGFITAEPSCRPLTGSLCGAGESNGGPACTANALQTELFPGLSLQHLMRFNTQQSHFTDYCSHVSLGTSVSLLAL